MGSLKDKAGGWARRAVTAVATAAICASSLPVGAIAATQAGDVNVDLTKNGTITVTAGENRDGVPYDISGKDLRAVKLADFTAGVANASPVEVQGTTYGANSLLTGYDLDTVQYLEPAINAALKGNIIQPAGTTLTPETKSGLTNIVGEIEKTWDGKIDYKELDETNPMAWVVQNLYGSASSPWAGEIREWLNALCLQTVVNVPAGTYGVNGSGSMTMLQLAQNSTLKPTKTSEQNRVVFENLEPGVYAILDLSQASSDRASFASIPMLQCTTVINSEGAEIERLQSDDVRVPLYKATEIVRAADVTINGTTYKAGSVVDVENDLDGDEWKRDSVTYSYKLSLVYRTADTRPYNVKDAYGNLVLDDGGDPVTVSYKAGTIVYNNDYDAAEYEADAEKGTGYLYGAHDESVIVPIGSIEYKFDEVPTPHKWIVENADDVKSSSGDGSAITSESTLDDPTKEEFEATEVNDKLSSRGERSWNVDRSLGEDIEYQVQSTVPVRTGYYTYFYELVDVMSDGLTFDPTRTVVQVEKIGVADPVTLVEGEDYIQSVEVDPDTHETTVTWTFGHIHADGCSCDKDGSKSGLIGSFVADALPNEKLADGCTVYIDYRAHLNSRAETYQVDVNHVDLKYSNNWYDQSKFETVPAPEEPRVWSGEARIWKTDMTDHSLAGAEFQIYEQTFANGVAQFDASGNPVFNDEPMSLRELGSIEGVQTYQAATQKEGNHVGQASVAGSKTTYYDYTKVADTNPVMKGSTTTTKGTDRLYTNQFLSSDAAGTFNGTNGFGDPTSKVGGTNTDADDTVAANTMISPESGEILVKGLSDGYYKVVETRSPYGAAVLPTWTFKVTVTEGQDEVRATDADGNMISQVKSTGSNGSTVYKTGEEMLEETAATMDPQVQANNATVDTDGYVLVSDLTQDANKLVQELAENNDNSIVLEGTGNELTQKYNPSDGHRTYMQVKNARNIVDMPQTGAIGLVLRIGALILIALGAALLLRRNKEESAW